MSLPRGPRFPSFAGIRPQSSAKERPALPVGSRVLVTARGAGSKKVTLTDDTGTGALATLAHGEEVEVLAWRPRRGGDTRYRVLSMTGKVEGWLSATSLEPRQPPPAPPAKVGTPAGRPAGSGHAAPAQSPPTRRPPAAAATAATVAMKRVNHAPKSTRSSR